MPGMLARVHAWHGPSGSYVYQIGWILGEVSLENNRASCASIEGSTQYIILHRDPPFVCPLSLSDFVSFNCCILITT